jgi:hypothetical protein
VSSPSGGLVLWALVSDMAEYIHMTHCSGDCPGRANSGSVGGRVATKGIHHEFLIKIGSLRREPQGCVSEGKVGNSLYL